MFYNQELIGIDLRLTAYQLGTSSTVRLILVTMRESLGDVVICLFVLFFVFVLFFSLETISDDNVVVNNHVSSVSLYID